jgi:putative acetyltransferase
MSPGTGTIRPATSGDRSGILAVVADAFSFGGTRDAAEELAIVRATWEAAGDRMELVAEERGAVVGHLQAAPGRLDGTASAVVGVAPVCVASSRHGRGIGTALITTLFDDAAASQVPLLVLLGDPAYYGRFGFEPAGPLGLHYAPAGVDNASFQARLLAGYDAALRGEFSYCWE